MVEVTIIEIPEERQEWMLRELRRSCYGYLLALHILVLLARGKTPTEDDQLRVQRLAKIRTVIKNLRADEAFFWADEL